MISYVAMGAVLKVITKYGVRALPTLVILVAATVSSPVIAACLDLSTHPTVKATGVLRLTTFPGPPNYEDVRTGDKPEPAYILTLNKPFCVTGDSSLDDGRVIDRIQLINDKHLLKKLVGKSIKVKGADPFGEFTGHHHAPLLMTPVEASPI